MTGFNVQPAALRQLAQLVDRACEDVAAGQQHLAKMQDFKGGEGVINNLTAGHRDAFQSLNDWLSKLADPTLTSVSRAISDADTYYERTDHASAEKLDSTYPAADVAESRKRTGYVSAPGEPAAFQDVSEPQGRLQPVSDYEIQLKGKYDWWDGFSWMARVGAAIDTVSHVAAWLGILDRPINFWDEIVKPWVGDWAGVRAAADVLNNVGWNLLDVGTNIQWASQGTQQVWQGRAGDGAAVHLMNLVKPFEDAYPPIDNLAGQYKTASEEMTKHRDAVVNVLQAIGDAAIAAAISAGAAGGAASTGIGMPIAILAGGFSAYNIYKVADGIEKIFDLIGKMADIVSTVQAAQTNVANIRGDVSLPSLPDAPLNAPR
jgi:hypothetical protein